MKQRRRIVICAAIAVLAGCLGVAGHLIYRVTEVERNYLIGVFALRIVEDYVKGHGDWPRSWRDLEQLDQTEWREWLNELPTVKDRIFIDFDAQIGDLAQQDVDQFRAVRLTLPNGLFDDKQLRRGPVESLLATLRSLNKERGHP